MTNSDRYRHRTSIEVRFRDIDAFRHVNNAVVLSYVEQARVRYLREVLEADLPLDRLPVILARVELDFRSPIFFGEAVTVETRVERLGRSSISMSHRLRAGDDERVVAEAGTVLVTYDYSAAASIPVPDEWRTRISAYEGRRLRTESRPPAAVAG